MPTITEETLRNQGLDPGAMRSGEGKEFAGVIDDSMYTENDILKNQARIIARARQGLAMETGAQFSDELIASSVLRAPVQLFERNLNAETIQALMQGGLQRDQQYVGPNTDWTTYYLEPLAKRIYPFNTPFRNMLPRVGAPGIDFIRWRAITSVFGGLGPSVALGILQQQNSTGPNSLNYNWVDKNNLLRQIAIKDKITEESEIYGRMFDPAMRAKIAAALAPALMLIQESWYLNAGQKLWPGAPCNTLSTSPTGGSLAANTYWIIATVSNANGETLAYGGSTPVAVSIATTGSTSTITFNIMRVPMQDPNNPLTYNVYVGTGGSQPANTAMYKQATGNFSGTNPTTDPGGYAQGWITVTLTTFSTGGTQYSATVTAGNTATAFASTNTPVGQALTFDGWQSLVYQNSGTLSTVGEGGATAAVRTVKDANGVLAKSDIDSHLEAMHFNAMADPQAMLVGIRDHKAVTNIVMNATNFRVNATPNQAGLSDLVGGGRAVKWVNQTTGTLMDIVMCPYLQQGTIGFVSLTMPFPTPEVLEPPLQITVNKEMWAREYQPDQSAMTQWQYANFVNESMKCIYLGGQGLLQGIVTP